MTRFDTIIYFENCEEACDSQTFSRTVALRLSFLPI